MKLFFLFLVLMVATASLAQLKPAIVSISESEKKGAINQLLGNTNSFTSASSNFTTSYARFQWNINPAIDSISGSVTYYFNVKQDANNIVFDLDNVLVVDSISMHNTAVSFTQKTDKTLAISFLTTILAGQSDSVQIYYHGIPASNDFGSFTKQNHNSNIPVLWTLSEPYGARDWWPCRNGLDDKIDSIDIYITHPSQYTASANGLLTGTITNNGFTTSHFKHRYPIATYLVGIAVTNYTTFTKSLALQQGNLPVTTTVYPEYLDYFQTYISPVYNALQLYDKTFGPYPFMKERYGQTEFDWGGGMEHQSNSFVTNADEYLMAHELAHQWFGDKITLGSWQDIWLNEGFATYIADLFYTEHFHPESLAGIVSGDMLIATADPNGSVWVDDTTSVDRIFSDNLSYKKGAMLLRMLRWTLGDSLFFKGINNYSSDTSLQYKFARTKDLQRNLEAASNQSLDYFFTQWFYGKGYPLFTVHWNWKNNKVVLQITETTTNNSVSLFRLPLQLLFKTASQQQAFVVNIQQNNTYTTLPLNFNPDSVLIDPSQYIVTKNNVALRDTLLQVPDETTDNNVLKIYPNPANTFLHIQLLTSDTTTFAAITIVNSAGITVYKKTNVKAANNIITLPVAQLEGGVYFVLLQNENKTITKKKFIKQ